jgi:5'-3' exonuclease
MTRMLLIDIDGMFYHSIGKETLEECMITFREKLQNCLDKTECTHWVGFVGKGKTFRHIAFPEYKSNRTQEPPKYLSALKEWAITEFKLYVCKNFESDDAVNYFYKKDICKTDTMFETREMLESALELCISDKYPTFEFESVEVILASPDKDLLQGISCKEGVRHFNYSYKLADKANPATSDIIKGWWIETSESEADVFKRMQVVVGDTADRVKGLPGKGIKYWEKISKEVVPSWGEILQLYCVEFGVSQGIFEFQKNYRLLHLLDCDEDFLREINELPMFPEIQEVPTKPEVQIDETNTF